MHSLRRLVWLAFVIVSMLLVVIISLGMYQYRLSGEYSRVIGENERALFHFMTIREAITESLVFGNWQELERVIPDLEKLNSQMGRLKDNRLISPEVKLALAEKVDLAGLVILLRRAMLTDDRGELSKKLQEHLRGIADYLIQYDRIVVEQARARIVNFQLVVIGALGIIVTLACFSLLLLYKNTVAPLMEISYQLRSGTFSFDEINLPQPTVDEVAALVEAIGRYCRNPVNGESKVDKTADVRVLLGEAVNENTNRLNGIINYAQLLQDSTAQQLTPEQHEMLEKIINSSSHIAKDWQKLSS
jgi:hypothetical protein